MSARVQAAWRALATVLDPDAGISVVDLGLVYDVRETDRGVAVVMTLTTEACPAGRFMVESAEEALRARPEIGEATVELTFDPPWTPDRVSGAGRARLGRGRQSGSALPRQ